MVAAGMQLGQSDTDNASPGSASCHETLSTSSCSFIDVRSLPEFQITRPELLRAALAGKLLRNFASVVRSSSGDKVARGHASDCFHLSFQVHEIADFWSHRWHGLAWPKVAALMFHYNTFAAIMCGMLSAAALAGIIAFSKQRVPCIVAKLCCLFAGCFGFMLGTVFWTSSRRVFLDKVSICQTDLQLKSEGIACLGGFLRHSDTFLVIWDSTYLCRMWCVYELVCFAVLRSDGQRKRIHICPAFHGSFMIWLFAAVVAQISTFTILVHFFEKMSVLLLTICVLIVTVSSTFPIAGRVRSFAREVDAVSEQVESFSFVRSQCFCCTNNHRHPDTGHELPCDRERVHDTMVSCFGSLVAAEMFFRKEIKPSIIVNAGLPYRKAIIVAMPIAFIQIADIVSVGLEDAGEYHPVYSSICSEGDAISDVVWVIFRRISTGLLWIPFYIDLLVRISKLLKNKSASRCFDRLRSVGVTLLVLLAFGVACVLNILLSTLLGCSVIGTCFQMVLRVFVIAILYRGRLLA
eukprot:TRINITY_DN7063_c0_g1_i1.p1 TRINITY_DN7063_c0_g1~~TRINITY_DN7063_c0_g1_i1.p1  ORF type:complete len:545 (+),score=34.12 TRINITY_DN7063_c0_g1_i1:74-1636(+)